MSLGPSPLGPRATARAAARAAARTVPHALTRAVPRTVARVTVAALTLSALALSAPALAAGSSDTVEPTMNSFSVQTPQVDVSDPSTSTLSVDYDATDDASGVTDVQFYFTDANDHTREARAFQNGATLPDDGTATVTADDTWFDGDYTLSLIRIYDGAGNYATYKPDQTIVNNPSTATGPTTHTFDFSDSTVEVTGSTADNHAPGLTSLSSAPGTVQPGDQLSFPIGYDAADPSTITFVKLIFTNRVGQTTTVQGATDGGDVFTAPLLGTAHAGHYTLTAAILTDAKSPGYQTSYDDQGRVALLLPDNATSPGPSPVAFSGVTLDVSAPPTAPTGVTAAAKSSSALVHWAPALSDGYPITRYVVTASPGGRTATVSGSATSATVTGLTGGAHYTFTVTATSSVGTSPASDPSASVTPYAKPSRVGRPTVHVAGRSATISWKAAAAHGAPVRYTVQVAGPTRKQPHTTATHVRVTGLKPGRYTVNVVAANVAGSAGAGTKATFIVKK